MKVRVCYTTDVDEQLRLAIGYQRGHEGPATREEIQEWFRQNGCENCDDILSDYDNHIAGLQADQERG
jgi:hypothetical protein